MSARDLPVKDRLPRGYLKPTRHSIIMARLRAKTGDRTFKEIPEAEKIEIARELLRLQLQKKLRVWVDGFVIHIAEYSEDCTAPPARRKITWATAGRIVEDGGLVPKDHSQ